MINKPEIVKILRREESSGKLRKNNPKIRTRISMDNNETNNKKDTNQSNNSKYLINAKTTLGILINLISDPAVVIDKKGRFLEISNRVEDLTGVKREELIGTNFMKTDFITAKSKAILIKNLAKRMLGEKVEKYEIEAISKDDEKVSLEVNGIKIDYDGKPADLVIFHDISAQKKTEKELKDSKEQWFHLLENIPDIIMTIDQDGKILTINHAIEGLKKEEVIGKNLKEYESPEYQNIREESLKKVFKTGKSQTYEIIGVDKQGQYNSWYETRIIPITYEDQNKKAIMISRDITTRKKTEKNLKEKIDELEKFQNVTIDRELKMIELKREINELCQKYGEKPRYILEEDEIEKEIAP
jgi:PAS domain S-box-containing protein